MVEEEIFSETALEFKTESSEIEKMKLQLEHEAKMRQIELEQQKLAHEKELEYQKLAQEQIRFRKRKIKNGSKIR